MSPFYRKIETSYGKVIFGTLGKYDEKKKLSFEETTYPSNAIDWHNYANKKIKEVLSKDIQVYSLNQEHGKKIWKTDDIDTNGDNLGDGLISKTDNECLVIRTADCVPVFFFSTRTPFVAVLHSGWKGTFLGITESLLSSLSEYDIDPKDCKIIIGPYIQKENYEIKWDVAQKFIDLGEKVIERRGEAEDSFLLDTGAAIEERIKRMGLEIEVQNENWEVFGTKDFFSHRAKEVGRNLNFILWES